MRLRTLEETVRDGGERRRIKESEEGRSVRGWRRRGILEKAGEGWTGIDEAGEGRRRPEKHK